MKMICFDMDGTIADLYAVPNWLDKLRAEDASPLCRSRSHVGYESSARSPLEVD